jgi:LEA14-like dessication related protein
MLILTLLLGGLFTGCAGNFRDVTDEPPQASIDGIERQGDTVRVELALGNVNDVPMRLSSVDLELTLDGVPLASGRRDTALMISANGREVLRIALPAEARGLDRLDRLSTGDAARLPWTMNLALGISEGPDRRTRTEGWLHPVPGQPDRFR